MSINLQTDSKLAKDSRVPLKLHYIPAKTTSDGKANVDNYFNNYTTVENGYLSNSLRGYPLQGVEFDFPTDFEGVVFQETKQPLDENSDRLFKVTGIFDKIVYWNYDKVPSKGDALRQAIQVIDIADELCKPISLEDIEQEMKERKESNKVKAEL